MTTHKIEPHRITKPIQLLAAWIIGLILTDSIFLYIQEDTFYHEYINKKTAVPQRVERDAIQDVRIDELEKMLRRLHPVSPIEHMTVGATQSDWDVWPVAVNFQHPQYLKIREALRAESISVSSVFGNDLNSNVPSKWVVAINPAIPFQMKTQLLKTLIPFDFDGFELHVPVREVNENEDVYIGGYGIGDYCEIDEEFKLLIARDIEEVDFNNYYRGRKLSAEK